MIGVDGQPAIAPEEFRAWIAGGDAHRAGDWLVRHHGAEVLGLCTAMVRDRVVAEDLTQDIFARAFAALDRYRGDASVRSWLLAIARNRCIDHLRARHRDLFAGDDDVDVDARPAETPLPPDLLVRRAEVEDALASLSEGDRALIVLRFKNGLGYPELAAAFGLREGTVRMRVSRALSRMREALAPVPAGASFDAMPLGEARARRVERAAPSAAMAPPPAAKRAEVLPAARMRRAAAPRSPAPAAPTPRARHALADYFAAAGERVSAALARRLDGLLGGL